MQTATVTARYVNPPKGKGPASIKDAEGRYWKFWTRDIPLDRFQPNATYKVGYETEKYNGEDQYYIKAVSMPENGGDAPPPPPPAAVNTTPRPPNGHTETQRSTAPKDAERMFVCSILNAAMQSGRVDFSRDHITAAVEVLRASWQETFGQDQ